MEFKMSEQSKKNLNDFLDNEKKEKENRVREYVDKLQKRARKFGFKDRFEFFDWVMSGKLVVGKYDRCETIRYDKKEDVVSIKICVYDDIDLPIGYETITRTPDEFEKWLEVFKDFDENDEYIYMWEKVE